MNKKLIFALYTLIVVCIGFATVIEKYHGTAFVGEHIYGAWWFSALWGFLVVAALAYMMKQKLYKRTALMLLHMSFVVILAGALTTHLLAHRGTVRLVTNLTENTFVNQKDNIVEHLPFSLTLKEFRIVNYPGTDAPLDYQSIIQSGSQEVVVSMNHIGYIDGYRLFQQSYSIPDQSPTTSEQPDVECVMLGVSYDPYGIAITYIGYLMLLLGMIATLLSRHTQLRALYRKAVTTALLLVSVNASAAEGLQTVRKDIAHSMGTISLLYQNRICPLNTVATDFVMKLTGSASWEGYSADEIFTSWMIYYSPWEQQKLIRVKSREVQQLLGIDGQWASYSDFLDEYHEYKLKDAVKALRTGEGTIDKKSLMDADEKFHMVEMFYRGEFIKMFPYRLGNTVDWYTPGGQSLPREIPVKEQFFIKQSMDFLTESIVTGQHDRAMEIIAKIKLFQREMLQVSASDGTATGSLLPSESACQAEIFYNTMRSQKWPVFLVLTLSLLLCACLLFMGRLSFAARLTHTCKQRARDDAFHGVGFALADLYDISEVPCHLRFWPSGFFILLAGSHAGRHGFADYAADACAPVTVALRSCDDGHVCLCAVCTSGAVGCAGAPADEERWSRLSTGTNHRAIPAVALSGSIPAYRWNIPGCCLG